MNYTNLFRKMFFLLIVIGMGIFFLSSHTNAFASERIDFDRMEPVEFNAVISKINKKEAYVIVGEKKVYAIEFKIGGKRYRTNFVSQSGGTYDIFSLRISLWEGERVLVRGFKLTNGDIIGGTIKKISSRRR